jgi:hypothetical protein
MFQRFDLVKFGVDFGLRGRRFRGPEPNPVAGFVSERWPASNRNGGRNEIGIGGRNASEFALRTLSPSN